MLDFTTITAEVAREKTIADSIIALFAAQGQAKSDAVAAAIADTMANANATAAQVQAAAQAALDQVDADFAAQNNRLADAVIANTPAAPAGAQPPV